MQVTHPINTRYQHTLSIHPTSTLDSYTLFTSTHPDNLFSDRNLSTNPLQPNPTHTTLTPPPPTSSLYPGGSSSHTPTKVIEMESLLHQLQSSVAGPFMCKESWLVGGVGLMEASWKTQKESQIPKSNPKLPATVPSTTTTAVAAGVVGGGVDVSNGSSLAIKDTLRQIHVLFTEMAR